MKKIKASTIGGPATTETMQALHTLLVTHIVDIIEKGEATAALMGVARSLLRDSGIVATAVPGSPMAKLIAVGGARVLPFANGAPNPDATKAGAGAGAEDDTRRMGAFDAD